MAESESQLVVDKACVIRFVVFGALMGLANIATYLYSRGENIADDIVEAGWPFHCYREGGIVGMTEFSPWALMGDIIVAVILTGLAAWIFREGIWKTLRKWKTWGTPYAEG